MSSLNFNVESILPNLTQVANVVCGKSTLAILDCVHLFNSNGKLNIEASDSETWISMSCESINIDGDVNFCVDAKNIVSTLRNLGNIDVIIDIDLNKKLLYGHYGKKGKFQLPILNGDDFVCKNDISADIKNKTSISPNQILNAISLCEFAVANDELRPIMNGIHFEFTNEYLESAASDGHKLVYYIERLFNDNQFQSFDFTLPLKPSKIISQLLAISNDDVNITYNNEHIEIVGNCWNVLTRLCVGKYPNIKSVLPKGGINKVIVDKEKILAVLNRIMPLGSQNSKLVKMTFVNDEITMSAEDIDWSTSAEESIDCRYVGEELQIGFKGDFLTQIIKNIKSDDILIEINTPTSAVVFKPNVNAENTNYTSLLMPLVVS